jgi:hypothetical protein
MAQQWLTNAVRDAYSGRPEAVDTAAETARVKAWLASLPLDRAAVAALLEPIEALEDGLHQAALAGRSPHPGAAAPTRS